jgi:outer membrane protein OmpA-like peptidoglycan-associated protein
VNALVNDHPQIKITLEGHTDDTGSDDLNQHLSEDRANAVKDYLVSKNVDPARISVAGFGKTRPAGDNATTVGKKMNRRVEFIVSQ